MAKLAPSRTQLSISECATLFPSPTKETLRPRRLPNCLLQREDVGKRLAGMIEVAQRVDDRNIRPLGQLVDGALEEDPGHDALGPAVEIARHIFDRLAVADQPGDRDGIAAELLDGEFEGQTGAQRRLFEQQAQVTATQRVGIPGRASSSPSGKDRAGSRTSSVVRSRSRVTSCDWSFQSGRADNVAAMVLFSIEQRARNS